MTRLENVALETICCALHSCTVKVSVGFKDEYGAKTKINVFQMKVDIETEAGIFGGEIQI